MSKSFPAAPQNDMVNHFTLFDLAPVFEIDEKKLEQDFLTLQKECHPDRFATKSPAEKLASAQKTVALNEAYQNLKSPLARSIYLLSLHGFELKREEQTINDPVILMKTLEQREELESRESLAAIDEFLNEIEKEAATYHAALKKVWQKNDAAAAMPLTLAWHYLEKLRLAALEKKRKFM